MIAKEGGSFTGILENIAKEVYGPVHAEVLSLDYEGIVAEGMELSKIAPNIVIKIPMIEDGLKAAKTLSEKGINTNITLIFSPGQAILAAKAGATYVCPFLGRLDDIGHDGLQLLAQIKTIFDANPELSTQIIAASIRTPAHMTELASMGIDILTAPTKVLKQMQKHPLTDAGIAAFVEDAKKFSK